MPTEQRCETCVHFRSADTMPSTPKMAHLILTDMNWQGRVVSTEASELNKRITDLTFRLSACLAITEQLLEAIVPMADTEARDALFKLRGYADLDNKL